MKHNIYFIFCLSLLILFASCASHTDVYTFVEPGDTVKVVTKDDEETSFVVVEVTDEAIVGENVIVLFNDITYLQEKTNRQYDNSYYTIYSFPYLEPDPVPSLLHLFSF